MKKAKKFDTSPVVLPHTSRGQITPTGREKKRLRRENKQIEKFQKEPTETAVDIAKEKKKKKDISRIKYKETEKIQMYEIEKRTVSSKRQDENPASVSQSVVENDLRYKSKNRGWKMKPISWTDSSVSHVSETTVDKAAVGFTEMTVSCGQGGTRKISPVDDFPVEISGAKKRGKKVKRLQESYDKFSFPERTNIGKKSKKFRKKTTETLGGLHNDVVVSVKKKSGMKTVSLVKSEVEYTGIKPHGKKANKMKKKEKKTKSSLPLNESTKFSKKRSKKVKKTER